MLKKKSKVDVFTFYFLFVSRGFRHQKKNKKKKNSKVYMCVSCVRSCGGSVIIVFKNPLPSPACVVAYPERRDA